jgi:hypothetical protein
MAPGPIAVLFNFVIIYSAPTREANFSIVTLVIPARGSVHFPRLRS